MILLVIRHGESEADILDVIEGRADFNLTERGRMQAKLMSQAVVSNYKMNKIYASPLKRAKQTAEQLSQVSNVPVEFMEDLMEFNNGLIAGLKRDVANQLYPKDENLPFDQAMYEMESLKDFRLRAEKVLLDILEKSDEKDVIAIISHGGFINRLYQSFMKMPLNTTTLYPTGDTGIHVWKIISNERTIEIVNDTSHLKKCD